jgi:16S rRNA G1207 methylase RsmC
VSVEGLAHSAQDPGVGLLAAAVRAVPPQDLLLVHSGPLPGLRPGATRLVLDVRELSPGHDPLVIPASLAWRDQLALSASPGARESRFAAAVVWPRAHLGKDFSEACLALGALALRPGGQLLCAVRKAKGGPSLARAMTEMCGAVDVVARDAGYFLYMSEKTGRFDAAAAAARLDVRYEIADPLLGPTPLLAAPGVFCRKHLDDGTRALLAHLEASHVLADSPPRRVLDLGAGVGPLALWAARRWPEARVLAVDSNLLAVALVAENARRLGCADRVEALASDGLPARAPRERADLALVNPPTHAEPAAFAGLVAPLRAWLRPGAPAWFVVNRAGRLAQVLTAAGAQLAVHEVPGFSLVRATWPSGQA